MVVINVSWSKIGFSDEINDIVTKLDDRKHKYPLVYVLSLLEDGIVRYPNGFSRTIYIGRSDKNAIRGRMRAHLNWMRKALLLNPKLAGFRVGVSADGDIGPGETGLVEGHCLLKFSKNLGGVPLFNTNSARRFLEDVKFVNDRNMFRCSAEKGNANTVVDARGEERNG